MGILKRLTRSGGEKAAHDAFPSGSLAVNRAGVVIASTLPGTVPMATLELIGRTALHAFASARKIDAPLSEWVTHFNGLKLRALELRGGALIFLDSAASPRAALSLPAMNNPTLDDFILYLETYIECWKQFNHYLNLARQKRFTPEDEMQFLEIKSLVTQGLEAILATVEQGGPRKDEVIALINGAPSIRYLSEHSNTIGAVESQWHKTFLTLQSLLGRLKVQQQKQEGGWSWGALFGRDR